MRYQDAFIRRDITINAMGIDMQSLELVDLYGGLQDLQNKILRAPDLEFFVQDPLRLLRVMQFVGRFEMSVDQGLSDACKIVDLSSVSQERIEQEFTKLFLQSARPSVGLQWLVDIGRFHDFFPGIDLNTQLIAMIDHAAKKSYASDQEKLACLWAIMAGSLPIYSTNNVIEFSRATIHDKKFVIDFMKKLTRHQKIVDRVADLVWYEQIIGSSLTDAQLKWLAYWLSPDCSLRLLLQYVALKNDDKKITILFARVEKLEILDAPVEPLLTGKDFLDVAQGPELGKLVRQAYQIQIDQGIVDRSVLKLLVLED
jgi:tRNA nucleotidyltransferase (CCA-adding enzyme)